MTAILDRAPAASHPEAARRPMPFYRAPFRPDIEGMRAIAVIAVVAYHAALPRMAGGFVGVDVFFVISGFLITSLMLVESAETGTISLPEFYARRAKRILPGAATTLAVTGLLCWLFMPLLRVYDTAQDLLMSALYASNWRFIATGTNYLTQDRAPSPFLHFWSLAVEEQFYIVWPMVLLGALWVARRLRIRVVPVIALCLLALTGVSFELSREWTISNPGLAYMASPTRAWQFGLGALLALVGPWLVNRSRWQRVCAGIIGWVGVGAVVASVLLFSSHTSYPGVAALLPTCASAAIIFSGSVAGVGGASIGRLLAIRPMRAIGRVSYAWYLWHWPAIVLVESVTGKSSWPVLTAAALGSIVPAFVTLRLVERPLRFSRAVNRRPSGGLSIGVIATLVALTAGLTIQQQVTASLAASAAAAQQRALSLDAVFGPASTQRNSGPVTPSALAARSDFPAGHCITDATSTAMLNCHFGSDNGPQAVLFGDSHAHQWQPALQNLVGSRGWGLTVLAHSGCPAAPLPDYYKGLGQPQCNVWRQAALSKILTMRPQLIIVSSYSHYTDNIRRLGSWDSVLTQLRGSGADIAYLVDTPWPNKDIPVCVSGSLNKWSACSFRRSTAIGADPVVAEVNLGREPNTKVLDLNSYLCPSAECPAVSGGVVLYRDDTHITATAARVLQPAMAAALDADGLMKPVH
jgi:peptidoglycan/LPS O-acetylase OafA/YrhL